MPVLAILGGLAIATAGCRNCGDRCGWFSSRLCDPCRSAARSASCTTGACVDPATGLPVSNPLPGQEVPGMLIPGAGVPVLPGPGGPASELPMPQPSDLIPRPGVPYAPPTPAPGDGFGALPAPRIGVPVKDTK